MSGTGIGGSSLTWGPPLERFLLVVAMGLRWMDGQCPCLWVGGVSPLARGPLLGGAGLLLVYPSMFWEASPPVEASFLQVSHPLEVANPSGSSDLLLGLPAWEVAPGVLTSSLWGASFWPYLQFFLNSRGFMRQAPSICLC